MFFHKGAKGARFDIEKYNKLKEEVTEVSSFTHKHHMRHSFHGLPWWFVWELQGVILNPCLKGTKKLVTPYTL